MIVFNRKHTEKHTKMKRLKQILIFTVLLFLLTTPATSASVSDASGTVYTTYDQIYASTTLSSSEKLSLIKEMAGWTPELEAYMEWKNSGGLEAYQAAVSGGNSDYGWDEAPGDGLGDSGTNIEPEYSYQERQAYDAAYEAYQAEFAAEYDYPAVASITGSGTEADPYLISSLADLQSFRDSVDAGTTTSGKYWKLTADIDMGGSANNWNPIGSSTYPFKGNFDGDGHILSNLYVSGTSIAALFHVGGGSYKNLGIENAVISTSTGLSVSGAALGAWYSDNGLGNTVTVENCYATISSLSVNCNDNGGGYASGLIGGRGSVSSGSYITNSYVIFTGSATINNADQIPVFVGVANIPAGEYTNIYGIVNSVSFPNTASSSGWGSSVIIGSTANEIKYNNCVALSGKLTGPTSSQASNGPFSKIGGPSGIFTNCYGSTSITYNGNTYNTGTTTNKNGAPISSTEWTSFNWWDNTLNFDFDNTWYWDDNAEWQDATGATYYGLPKLQVFQKSIPPTISSISVTPTTGGQQNTYTLSVSASSSAEGGISYYEWYSREGINDNWVLISNTSVSTTTFIPGSNVIGDVYFKCVVTGADGGVIDSYDAGFTNIKITVSPEGFVPNQQAWSITSEPLEIEKTTTNTYNPTNQFALDRDIIESKFISKSEAILVYGNAVYRVTADANTVTPISSNHNGDVIVDSYIGLNHAVVVDSQGKIVRYNYSNENTVGIIADNVKDLVCNDNFIVVSTSDNEVLIFSTISGELLSYVDGVSVDSMDISSANDYVVFSDGVTLKSITNLASTSPVITTLSTLNGDITSINHVRNTNNFIITITTSTYVVSIGSNGISYTQVSVSSDGIGLEGISFNTLSNYVGYKDETIYWYDSESVNQGSAELVSDINTVSMAYQNGLWTAFGGNSMTLFVSTQNNGVWETIQSIVLDNIVRDVALSDSGYYMMSSTDNTLYLFSRATPLDVSDTILTTKYYLEITTYVDGIITSGQTFSVSAQGVGSTSYTTDSSGTYTIEVYPTYTYEITYGGETIIYVANNYALQYLNLDTGVEYYLDGVTYSTNFQDNAIINMYYRDTNNHDNLVRYYIVDTDNVLLYDSGTQQTNNFFAQYSLNTDDYVKVVLTITRYDGGAVTISDGNVFTSAWNYIKRALVGDDGFTVILPDATKPLFPLELPMIDGAEMTSDIKQIFFCGILMVIAGLFGVNHSARGTLILGLVALVFTFFKFIYIDWAWVMTMVVIGVLTVFSYAQNN